MNTELKLVVINNEIPKHILWVVQMGASYRTFDDENEARIHAEVLRRFGHIPVTIRQIEC